MLTLVAAFAVPAAASAYDWPLKPFKRQHPIRGGFEDPRISYYAGTAIGEAFHFGVDISAPDYTPVYSVSNGIAFPGAEKVRVRVTRTHEFAYWHITPVVKLRQRIHVHQLLGYVVRPHAHVHFAEKIDGVYVNPLHAGGLSPYADRTKPVVQSVSFVGDERTLAPNAVSGIVNLEAVTYDPPAMTPPAPWNAFRVTPALLRWRVIGAPALLDAWQTAVDFRWSLLPQSVFDLVYAPGTWQNKVGHPGQYTFYLRQTWDTSELPNGTYTLQVEATDMRGNVGSYAQQFTVAN